MVLTDSLLKLYFKSSIWWISDFIPRKCKIFESMKNFEAIFKNIKSGLESRLLTGVFQILIAIAWPKKSSKMCSDLHMEKVPHFRMIFLNWPFYQTVGPANRLNLHDFNTNFWRLVRVLENFKWKIKMIKKWILVKQS